VFVIPLSIRPPPIVELVEILNRGLSHVRQPILNLEASWKEGKKERLPIPDTTKPEILDSTLLFDDLSAPTTSLAINTVPSLSEAITSFTLEEEGLVASWGDSLQFPEVQQSSQACMSGNKQQTPGFRHSQSSDTVTSKAAKQKSISQNARSSEQSSVSMIRSTLFRHPLALQPKSSRKP
jgi:hypothetical protein